MATVHEITLGHLLPTLTAPEWSEGPLHFLGDIGGTNARLGFAKTTNKKGVNIIYIRFHMTKKDINQLKEFFVTVLKALGPHREGITKRITSGAISIPGPVTNGVIGGPFNNLKGIAKLAEYPRELFPPCRSSLLNDLQAGAYGVLATSDAGIFSKYFKVMWEGTHWPLAEPKAPVGSILGEGKCFVAAPGTGLGTSFINYDGVSKQYSVLPLEYSSTTVTAKEGMGEYLKGVAAYNGLSQFMPNKEHLTNGKAIEYNYQRKMIAQGKAKAGEKCALHAGQIANLARKGDQDALDAMATTFGYLVEACSEAVMTFLPLTCVLIGDNICNDNFFFSDDAQLKRLREKVMAHPMEQQYGFIGRTTFLRQVKAINLNMLGCYGYGTHLHSVSSKL